MRTVKDIPDIQRALNDLFAWKDRLVTGNWDMKRLRITNASPGIESNDYATVSQLPAIVPVPPVKLIHYTIVFSPAGVITIGEGAPFVAGRGRTGIPIQVWLAATNKPTSGPLSCNVNINGNALLDSDLTMNPGDDSPVISSIFIASSPRVPYLGSVTPVISAVGGASLVSIGVVLQLDPL